MFVSVVASVCVAAASDGRGIPVALSDVGNNAVGEGVKGSFGSPSESGVALGAGENTLEMILANSRQPTTTRANIAIMAMFLGLVIV
jgi:hypothetical protein